MVLASSDLFREEAPDNLDDRFLREDRSLQHDVYGVVIEWIHQAKLRPGDRVSEAAIARFLGISRGPVREAISRLDYEGLVTRRPRRGAVVSEFTVKDIEDIASTRQLIEGHAARSACTLIEPTEVEELHVLIDSMKIAAEAGQWTETALLNGRFHQTVVRISGNKILGKMWQTLHPLAWLLAPMVSPNTPHDPESLVVRHEELIDVLRAGDPDRAEAAFHQHVLRSSQMTMARVAPKLAGNGSTPGLDDGQAAIRMRQR